MVSPTNVVILTVASAFLVHLGVVRWIRNLVRAFREARSCPGKGFLPNNPGGWAAVAFCGLWPPSDWVGDFTSDFKKYAQFGSSCISTVMATDDPQPVYFISDAETLRFVNTDKAFDKDVSCFTLNLFGDHILRASGSDWKRHRAIANPAFNEANNARVWREATRFANAWLGWIESKMGGNKRGQYDIHSLEDLSQLALLIFCSAAFGQRASWKEPGSEREEGETLDFQSTLEKAISLLIQRSMIPDWGFDFFKRHDVPGVSAKVRNVQNIFDKLEGQLYEAVSSLGNVSGHEDGDVGKGSKSMEEGALMRNLVEANRRAESGEGARHLSDWELISDMFWYLLAGHETSATALTFTFAYLALHPEVQEKLYQEVYKVWPNGAAVEPDDKAYQQYFPQLVYTHAVFYEVMRLTPPAPRTTRIVLKDTEIPTYRFDPAKPGEKTLSNVVRCAVPVKANNRILVDIRAIHRSPLNWGEDADEFRPERFIDTGDYKWPRDAFAAFSFGGRNCIGRHFAVAESVCILALFVRRFRLTVPEKLKGLPLEEQRRRLLEWKPGMTSVPLIPVVGIVPRAT
ncbi:hypothetical protein PQX77_008383 [Marasmius sp. AFHP31]|nr:hypothetical protein PQX77_012996 [Marasmius sp. AFHP31]KAK1228518.1 hypothetical protein PQX77_008383 [Marasmius sp. AFHP31]